MKRREFLNRGLLYTPPILWPFLFSACSDSSNGLNSASLSNVILGGGSFKESPNSSSLFVISRVELDRLSLSTKITPFLPHGFHRNPKQEEIVAVFEKKGPGALIYNVLQNKIISILKPQLGRHFYGHGAYTADGKHLFSTETDLASRQGVIGIRDAMTFEYLGEFPSYGLEPHECKLIDGGETLVVTNGGGPIGSNLPSVTYIDVASQRLLERIELSNARVNTGHLAVTQAGGLVVISAPRAGMKASELGAVSVRLRGEKLLRTASEHPLVRRLFGEALSVCIYEAAAIAGVTHPGANVLTFWSLVSGKLIHKLDLPTPRGIDLDESERAFIVSYGENANLVRIPVDTLTIDDASLISSTYLTGSHIYNWSRSMSELHYPGPQV